MRSSEMLRGVGWIDRVVLGEPTDFVFIIGVTLLKMKRFLRNVGFTYYAVRRHDREERQNLAYGTCYRKLTRFSRLFGISIRLFSLM